MNMNFKRKLPIPKVIKEEYPLTEKMAKIKEKRDAEIKAVLSGADSRLLIIIGPCSADSEESVLDYLSRLKRIDEKVSDKLLIVPRIYTNKPRTTGSGYKGMLHQPNPTEHSDMLRGIIAIRDLHMKAIRDIEYTCADEMLYSENHRYLSDLLSYVAVGARSSEDQQHRLTASGLDIPVGMKNPTGGDLSIMLNSITAGQNGHTFIYRGWEVESTGNPYTHAILRGFVNKHGQAIPNYHYEDLINLCEIYTNEHFSNPAVIIDTNHSNSSKKYMEQIRIAKEVLHSRRHSADVERLVKGLMIESYIEDGSCAPSEHIYGKSITDPCLGIEKTERLLLELADQL